MAQNIWRPVDFENLDSQQSEKMSEEKEVEHIVISDEENEKSSISLGSGEKNHFP